VPFRYRRSPQPHLFAFDDAMQRFLIHFPPRSLVSHIFEFTNSQFFFRYCIFVEIPTHFPPEVSTSSQPQLWLPGDETKRSAQSIKAFCAIYSEFESTQYPFIGTIN